jgi:hypothetical protein
VADEPTIWKIAIRDELRARMATQPGPNWATTESERDWYLKNAHRPREDYDVVEVPGPIGRAIADERVRFERVRAELWQQRNQEREDDRG